MHNLIVQKFGGSSLATTEQIVAIAKKISSIYKRGSKLIIVTSAMGQTTNQLSQSAYKISSLPNQRELDMLLTTGERIAMALMAIAINDLGTPAVSFTGSQAGIMTDGTFLNANIIELRPTRVLDALEKNKVVVLAGFQGVDPLSKEITTLGRGGSDITAVAMAAHFKAERCEFLKDVNGVYAVDPKIFPQAPIYKYLTVDILYDFCFWGAKVLNYRAVEMAREKAVSLFIGRSEDFKIGTEIVLESKNGKNIFEEKFCHEIYGREVPDGDSKDKKKIKYFHYEPGDLLGVNSHAHVIEISVSSNKLEDGRKHLIELMASKNLPLPQILKEEYRSGIYISWLVLDAEAKPNYISLLQKDAKSRVTRNDVSTVTATYYKKPSQTQLVSTEDRIKCIHTIAADLNS